MKICTRLARGAASAMCLLVATAAPARPHGQEAHAAGLNIAALERLDQAMQQAIAAKEVAGIVGPTLSTSGGAVATYAVRAIRKASGSFLLRQVP